jgi:hypothetical protein
MALPGEDYTFARNQARMSKFSTLLAALLVLTASVAGASASANVLPTAESPSLRLGDNWGSYETFGGSSFRWVDDNAELIVSNQPTDEAKLVMTLEPGPSLGSTTFPLYILDESHHTLQTINVSGRTTLQLALPVAKADQNNPYARSIFYFHVDGGKVKLKHDPRTLNFRVFSLADLRPIVGNAGPDIVDPHNAVRVGDGWYPVEHLANQTFRWADNDSQFYVQSYKNQSAPLRILFAAGPGVSKSYSLELRDEAGHTLGHVSGSGLGQRRMVQLVKLKAGDNKFSLHIVGGGTRLRTEPHRTLNYRVFSIAAVR